MATTQATRFIVRCNAGEYVGALFLMNADDPRFGGERHDTVTPATRTPERVRADNGHLMTVYTGGDEKRYGVFSDWSARVLEAGTPAGSAAAARRRAVARRTRSN